jgi:hypothetical protein
MKCLEILEQLSRQEACHEGLSSWRELYSKIIFVISREKERHFMHYIAIYFEQTCSCARITFRKYNRQNMTTNRTTRNV